MGTVLLAKMMRAYFLLLASCQLLPIAAVALPQSKQSAELIKTAEHLEASSTPLDARTQKEERKKEEERKKKERDADPSKECKSDADFVCPQCKLVQKTAKCSDFKEGNTIDPETFPIRLTTSDSGRPEAVQGIFWLTKQKSSSALVSFAESNDGGGMSKYEKKDKKNWMWKKVGEVGGGKVRVAGDRVWSFHDKGKGTNYDRVEGADLVYTFTFDPYDAPTKAQIHPSARNYGISLGSAAEWLLDFEMHLLECNDTSTDAETPKDPYCENLQPWMKESVVWQRKSYILGIHAKGADYKAVQVVDGNGKKLPAFYEWINFCEKDPEAGNTPDEFHWHAVDNSPECVAKCPKPKKWG